MVLCAAVLPATRMPVHPGLEKALQKPADKLFYQSVLPEDFFLGRPFKVDLIRHQILPVLLFFLPFGREFSPRYLTGLGRLHKLFYRSEKSNRPESKMNLLALKLPREPVSGLLGIRPHGESKKSS
jgi:hypothetical protein